MADKKDIHRIYQLMGLIAPDEPFGSVKINAEADPLAFLYRESIKSAEGATGLFLQICSLKSDSIIEEKKILQQ